MRLFKNNEPCDHPGCLSHLSHPCEVCGRIGGEYPFEALTYEKAGILAKQTGYANEAHEPKGNEINYADATAFYMEGYFAAIEAVKNFDFKRLRRS